MRKRAEPAELLSRQRGSGIGQRLQLTTVLAISRAGARKAGGSCRMRQRDDGWQRLWQQDSGDDGPVERADARPGDGHVAQHLHNACFWAESAAVAVGGE